MVDIRMANGISGGRNTRSRFGLVAQLSEGNRLVVSCV